MTNARPVDVLKNIPAHELKSLVLRGIVRVNMTDNLPTRREETPEYKKHAHLKGQVITISEGARKYGLALSTISQWVNRGLIAVMGQEKNRKLISEIDLAYCAEVRAARPGAGKWLFDNDSKLPYTPETRGDHEQGKPA